LTTQAAQHAYFSRLKAMSGLKATLGEYVVEVLGPDAGLVSGLYVFESKTAAGAIQTIPARFTFVYKRDSETWKIIAHHSSVVPA
jgi:hypothetical protein